MYKSIHIKTHGVRGDYNNNNILIVGDSDILGRDRIQPPQWFSSFFSSYDFAAFKAFISHSAALPVVYLKALNALNTVRRLECTQTQKPNCRGKQNGLFLDVWRLPTCARSFCHRTSIQLFAPGLCLFADQLFINTDYCCNTTFSP